MTGQFDVVTLGAHILDVHVWPVDAIGPGQSSALVDTIKLSAAGTAAGTAVDMSRLGLRVATVGCIGEDAVGDLLLALLGKDGVDVSGVVRRSVTTTSATVLPIRRNGERPALHVRGANELFGAGDVPESVVLGTPFLHLGGPDETIGHAPEDIRDLVARAREAGVVVTADLLRGAATDYLEAATTGLRDVDYLMPNLEQLLGMTGQPDIGLAVARLRDLGFTSTVIVKLGADGSAVIPPTGEWTHLAGYPIDVVDTTGCGDAYCAGFILGLREGRSVVDACVLGTRAAALVAGGLGSDAGIVDRSSVHDEHFPVLPVVATDADALDALLP